MWQTFLYISRNNQWMCVFTKEDWKILKKVIMPNKNTPEDIYRPAPEYSSKEEKIPIFTYKVSEKNRGTRTLHQFFIENDMKWD